MSSKKGVKKNKSKEQIQELYWDHVLETGEKPPSVYSFCKKIDIKEKEFYEQFSSFEALVSKFWQSLVIDTQEALDADEDYQEYDSRAKLLAFFYTFFEISLEYRSRFLTAFPRREKALFDSSLCGMKSAFDESARTLMEEVIAEGGTMIPAKITQESHRGGWVVFLFLIDFWINDTSDAFQDTDSLIEKAVRFGHEVTRFSAIEAAVDLGKFLFGRNQ